MSDTNDLDNNNAETRPKSTSPTHSTKSQSSSPSHSTLLVIDDSSDSEEVTITKQVNNIPTKPQPTTNSQTSHIHLPPRQNSINHVIEQQRRRNSSIAKLLGGQPLHNQQYEEINQQIIDDQTAQNLNTNHESGNDSAIQRTRSSITRTLLMNSDRTNSMTKTLPPPPPPSKTSSGPSYGKDFEYLIHGEIDHDHGSSVNQRTNSASKIYPNLNSSTNPLAQSLNTMRLKRKRFIPKTSSNVPPFALHDPFELQTTTTTNSTSPTNNHSSNKYVHFESSKRPCYPNHQSYHSSIDKQNHRNSSPYSQFSIHDDQQSATICSSPSCHCGHASDPKDLTSTVQRSTTPTDDSLKSMRKAKSILVQPDAHERPRQRSYSNLSESSSTTIPLKKRLLDAYNNEQ